jgi:hypothetical protein
LAVSSCAISCHRSFAIPAPDLDGIRSVLVIESAKGQVIAIDAVAVPSDGSAPDWPVLARHGDADVTVLEYGCSLDRMGLKPGPQTMLKGSAAGRLPRAAEMLSIPGNHPSSWTKVDQLSPTLRDQIDKLDLPPDNLCRVSTAEFEPRPLGLPDDNHGPPAFSVPIDDSSVLAATTDGKYYRVDASGLVTAVSFGPSDSTPFVGGYRAPDGDLWLMSRDGLLIRGTFDRGFTTVTSSAVLVQDFIDDRGNPQHFAPSRIALRGPTTPDAPFELFASGNFPRTFARFDGERWRLLARINFGGIFIPAIAWIEPSHAIAIGVENQPPPDRAPINAIARYRSGAVTFESLPGRSGLSAIMRHPTLGIIVGRDGDGIYVEDSGWTMLPTTERILWVRTFSPLGEGFMYGGSSMVNFSGSSFAQYYPEVGFCPSVVYTDYAVSDLAPLGKDALVALTLAEFDRPLGIVLLERRHPPQECSSRQIGEPVR